MDLSLQIRHLPLEMLDAAVEMFEAPVEAGNLTPEAGQAGFEAIHAKILTDKAILRCRLEIEKGLHHLGVGRIALVHAHDRSTWMLSERFLEWYDLLTEMVNVKKCTVLVRSIVVGAALVALAACSLGPEIHETLHQSIPATGTPTVHVSNVAGTMKISAWSRPGIDLLARKSAHSPAGLRNIHIDVRTQGHDVFITTHYAGADRSGGVSYTIAVPADAALDLRNVAGTITVRGVRGNVTAATQAGTIGANLGKVAQNRAVDLSATTGTVDLTIARDSDATVTAHSTVGAISSDFASVSENRSNLVGSDASGKIGSGSATIRLTTTTGAITLKARS